MEIGMAIVAFVAVLAGFILGYLLGCKERD